MNEDGGLWSAMRTRKVIRTLGIYLAAAWVILQIGYLLVDIWQLPNWSIQAIFLLLLTGLPITAVLSWYYDISEEGLVVTEGDSFRDVIARIGLRKQIVAATCLSILIILISFGLLHLWPDSELDPRLRHLLKSTATSDDDPANAAFLLYGFTAPAGQDAYEFGRFITDTYETLGSIPDNPVPLKFTIERMDRIGLTGNEDNADKLFADIDSIPKILTANKEMISRYENLRQTPVFTEVIRPEPYSPVPEMQELLLAEYLMRRKIIYEAERGDISLVWNNWREEIKLRRSLLASANHLLMKFVARNLVSEIIRLRILLLARGQTENAGLPVSRLSLPERSVVSSLRFELVSSLNFLLEANDRSEFSAFSENSAKRFWFRVLPYRRNATINYIVHDLEIMEASLLETPELIEWSKTWKYPRPNALDNINNGAGMLLFSSREFNDWTRYSFGLHDLDRVILLSQVAEQMLEGGVTAAGADGWLLALPEEFRDPFTGNRPTWSEGVLSYPEPDLDFKADRGLDLPLL